MTFGDGTKHLGALRGMITTFLRGALFYDYAAVRKAHTYTPLCPRFICEESSLPAEDSEMWSFI